MDTGATTNASYRDLTMGMLEPTVHLQTQNQVPAHGHVSFSWRMPDELVIKTRKFDKIHNSVQQKIQQRTAGAGIVPPFRCLDIQSAILHLK